MRPGEALRHRCHRAPPVRARMRRVRRRRRRASSAAARADPDRRSRSCNAPRRAVLRHWCADHPVGDAVHPHQRRLAGGHLAEAAPHGEERVGDCVVNRVSRHPPAAVLPDRSVAPRVDLPEPGVISQRRRRRLCPSRRSCPINARMSRNVTRHLSEPSPTGTCRHRRPCWPPRHLGIRAHHAVQVAWDCTKPAVVRQRAGGITSAGWPRANGS